ncbi:cysteine methyltransferase [Rhodococcus sp. SRB_17]|uniref:methylated-DNA--[protein]-cysteine S-methyltransferase n=1 Tax=Rhodococcus sp. OK302 TaxID=1882769 RepID=UPI000B93C542|nr:methylated-DNA--[protein]-cysteine S-methyltransferase [Rhodococcus sp. OK302]NMM89355.1 cysteine methyltransferase [Rhodococcus sp. SRB_17]OYD66986.1 methylated-DNA-[protein]-cysteine S-methyltransferase [Rhodococcus sp. OK302]
MAVTRTHTVTESPIGPLTLVASANGLCGLYMAEHRHKPDESTFGDSAPANFGEVEAQLAEYFSGERTEFTVPLDPSGTEFQHRVWAALRTIPYGQTWTYLDLAQTLGNPLAVRAVAAANGKNPISIIVPCHRVVGSDGSLTGFAGGLDRKRYLLERESGGISDVLF